MLRKAKNWKHFSQTKPIYLITANFQHGIILIKFWKLAFNYEAKLSIDGKLFYEKFENFGTTLINREAIAF